MRYATIGGQAVIEGVMMRNGNDYAVAVRKPDQTIEVKTAAPMFDHNRSLLFDLDEDQLAKPEWYISKCRPRIGVDFIKTAKGMLTDEIRQELKNLDGFRFAPTQRSSCRRGGLRR